MLRRLDAEQVEQVRRLVKAVEAADGVPPLSDHVMLHLPRGGDTDVRHLLARSPSGELIGYAHLDVTDPVAGPSAELAVAPAARHHGVGQALVDELLRQSPDGRLRLWAHGEHAAAGALAKGMGFASMRTLWQMRMPLDATLPEVRLPAGVSVRTFQVGRDEQEWTAVNNLAFADHPDQGGWGLDEVMLREKEKWFDPAGFFLAFRSVDGGDRLVGFHWTKVHGGTEGSPDHAHEAVGEVYVVGVHPAEQGRGLGPALTLLGLHSLQERGLTEVMLYVDEANTNAIGVYERLGFTRSATDVCYARGQTAVC